MTCPEVADAVPDALALVPLLALVLVLLVLGLALVLLLELQAAASRPAAPSATVPSSRLETVMTLLRGLRYALR